MLFGSPNLGVLGGGESGSDRPDWIVLFEVTEGQQNAKNGGNLYPGGVATFGKRS